MHSRLLVFFWRRKCLFFGSSALFMVAIWMWGLFYTNNTNNEGKIISIKEFMVNHNNEGILQKLGFNEYKNGLVDAHVESLKFLKPTNQYDVQKSGKKFNN